MLLVATVVLALILLGVVLAGARRNPRSSVDHFSRALSAMSPGSEPAEVDRGGPSDRPGRR